MATRSHWNNATRPLTHVQLFGPLFRHYYQTLYNTLLTHTTPKTAINVMTAIFNSKLDNTSNHTATYHVPLHTTDYCRKYLIYRGSEHNGGVICLYQQMHTQTHTRACIYIYYISLQTLLYVSVLCTIFREL